MKSLNDIRSSFLDYFKKQGHEHVPSSSLIPQNDPTLLFTAAGMVQFKDVFTGIEKRPYSRATSAQKCLRAGGKHNDLENVGYTARHHTFFEMLGNFSFGDYFKEEAIYYAWELVTKDFALSKEKLLVTVYSEDEEARVLWKKIAGLPDHKIIQINTSDNFWSMGDTGPCGPCTEIFFDHGEGIPGGPPGSVDQDGDRFIEIWNLVFMQYEQLEGKKRINLPKPSVDTGMGVERIAAVLQGVHSNYDTDLFQTLIQASKDLTKAKTLKDLQSHNVIADHLRACSFLISDGVTPSNEGRGYVLRRIMRRAMRHAHLIGAHEPLMHQLVPTLINVMGEAYPELKRAENLIRQTLKQEEERFLETLSRGLKLLSIETSKLAPSGLLPGDVAFKLYDTFGFPLDLTQDVLKASHHHVDVEGFHALMEQQKTSGRSAWSGSGDKANQHIWFDLLSTHGETKFLGYDTLEANAAVQAIVKDGEMISQASAGEIVDVLISQTPFYAESGGQAADHGIITTSHSKLRVLDTQKRVGKLVSHHCQVEEGSLKVGANVCLKVDTKRRDAIRRNHSATHLLHAALRHVLGDHVVQKGSLVEADRFRFDFTHAMSLTNFEIQKIEDWVNTRVLENASCDMKISTPEQAIKEGAMALFGEKYGDQVRVVKIGPNSVELCGGTHVKRTGDIGSFKILFESGIAAGIRRIEGLTGLGVVEYTRNLEQTLTQLSKAFKSSLTDVLPRAEALLKEKKELEHHISDLRQKLALGGSGADAGIQTLGTYKVIEKHLIDVPAKDLKPLADQLKMQIQSGIVVVTSKSEDKVAIVIGVTDDLTDKLSAVELVQHVTKELGAKGGGGRPDMAQAGGDSKHLGKAIEALRHMIAAL